MNPIEPVTEYVFEKLRVAAFGSVSRQLLTDVTAMGYLNESLLCKLETEVLAQRVEDGTRVSDQVKIPTTWWEHWKQDHAPTWFRRRWPVQYRTVTMTVDLTRWATYPMADIPIPDDRLGSVVIHDAVQVRNVWSPDES